MLPTDASFDELSKGDAAQELQDEDFGFIAIDEDEDCTTNRRSIDDETDSRSLFLGSDQPPTRNQALHDNSTLIGSQYGGYRQFHGLADAPLKSLQAKLSHNHSLLALCETEVMKLRSIMRFAAEYHNPLLVRAQLSPGSSPLNQFMEASSECFRLILEIVTAASEENGKFDSAKVSDLRSTFERAVCKLEELEPLVKEGEEVTLKQAISAVSNQMKDFSSLMTGVISRQECTSAAK